MTGSAQPVIDGPAQPTPRDRSDGNPFRRHGVELPEHCEQITGGFLQIACRTEVAAGWTRGPKRQIDFSRAWGLRVEAERRSRRVVTLEHSGCSRGRIGLRFGNSPDGCLEFLGRDPAGPEQGGRACAKLEHGGFQPDGGRSSVQDQVDQGAEFVPYMMGLGGAETTVRISAGRCYGSGEFAQQCGSDRMSGHSNCDSGSAPGHTRDNCGSRPGGQYQGEGTGPEARGKLLGPGIRLSDREGGVGIGHMHDQWVAGRTLLGAEYPFHCGRIGGIRSEAVDGLGRKGHETAIVQI